MTCTQSELALLLDAVYREIFSVCQRVLDRDTDTYNKCNTILTPLTILKEKLREETGEAILSRLLS